MWNLKSDLGSLLLAVFFPVIIALITGIFLPVYFNNPVLFFVLIFVIIAGLSCFIVWKFRKAESGKDSKRREHKKL